jgi:hypothetical protein
MNSCFMMKVQFDGTVRGAEGTFGHPGITVIHGAGFLEGRRIIIRRLGK